VTPVRERNGGLLGWRWKDGGGNERILAIEQVVHFKLWNPYDSCLGLGELAPARSAAESDYLAGLYETNLWKNAGDRGPIIGLPAGVTLTDSQREQFVAQLREKRELAARGIFKAAFIDAAVTVTDPTVQKIDAAVIAGRAADATAVAVAFGVPPSMFTVAASYSIGSASDRYRLIEDTCAPTARKVAEGIERVSRMLTRSGNLFAWFDWSRHSVFAQVRAERIAVSATAWDRGVPWSTLNDWLNLDMPEFDGWEKSYLPFSATQAVDSTEDLPEDSTDQSEPGSEPALPDSAEDNSPDMTVTESLVDSFSRRVSPMDRDPRELRLWRSHMDKRKPALRRYQSAIDRELLAARSETLRNLASSGVAKGISKRASAVEIVFDLAKFAEAMTASLGKAAKTTLNEAGGQLYAEVGLSPSEYKMANDQVNAYLLKRENKVKDMTQVVHERVKQSLADGIDGGETYSELAARVREEFNGISKGHAKTIAMTEVGSAYSEARQDAMEQAGVKRKRWLTSGDSRVRDTHVMANGQTVGIADSFEVGGVSLKMPGDPDGPAQEVINCRCISISVAED
jgi:SPP1 gp7 family putative phage head morphogenesis protein